MLTTFDDHELVLKAVHSGAKGYLLKDVSLETLVEAVN
jgi:DNA-binding NarL/FixJ family response regulator